jgi:hypothetical protein
MSVSVRDLHRPLSSALDDSGSVSDMSTIAQIDEFQRRRQLQADKPGVGDGRLDRTSLRSDLERNRFVTFVMDSHEASESQVRDGMRSNPAMPASHTAEPLRSSSRRETDRARALTSRTSRQQIASGFQRAHVGQRGQDGICHV